MDNVCFFVNAAAPTEIDTLSLHDALPIYFHRVDGQTQAIRIGTASPSRDPRHLAKLLAARIERSEEHTSELQSRRDLVCRLLLEKKKLHNPSSFRFIACLSLPSHASRTIA